MHTTREVGLEIGVIFMITLLLLQSFYFSPVKISWIILIESVLYIGFHLFRPLLHILPTWCYINFFNGIWLKQHGGKPEDFIIIFLWSGVWLGFLGVAHGRHDRLVLRIIELSGDLTRLRTGSEWFARRIVEPDGANEGIATEIDAHAADAFAHFDQWWRRMVKSVSPLAGISATTLYKITGTEELTLITEAHTVSPNPRWKPKVSLDNPEIRMVLQEQKVVFGNEEWARRHLAHWVHQIPLNLSGLFIAPIRRDGEVDSLWLGILQKLFDEGLKENIRWIASQVQTMVELYGAAFRHQDQVEILKKIHEFSTRMAGALKVNDVLAHFIQVMQFILPFDGGFIALSPLEEDKELQLYWSKGFAHGVRQSRLRIPRHPDRSSWTSWIMQNREEIIRVEIKNSPTHDLPIWSTKGPQPPWTTILGIPLRVHSESIGITVIGREEQDFRADEIQWVAITATAAALALKNAQLYEKMSYQASRDGLTGVFNHRAFQEKLEQLINETQSPNATFREFALILIDIDHFKQVNDTYGHPFGDQVLKKVAGVIQRVVRQYDIVARYGGEEFAVLLPGCDAKASLHVAEEIRSGVEELRLHKGIDVLKVSVSGGVASFPSDARTRGDLIARADVALYHAKREGRNQIWHWQDVPIEPVTGHRKMTPPLPWWQRIFRR